MRIARSIALMLVLAGCGATMPNLDVYLENATDPMGQVYEDESIAIRFISGRDHLAFDLQNKTNGAIKILWDEIVFEDAQGTRHHVCRSKADFHQLDSPQKPTVVQPRSRIQERIIPKTHVIPCDDDPEHWQVTDMLVPAGADAAETRRNASEVIGKNCYLLLPLEVGGLREPYRFSFKIIAYVGPTGGGGAGIERTDVERPAVIK